MSTHDSCAELRADALAAFHAGVEASHPDQVLDKHVVRDPAGLVIAEHLLPKGCGRNILVALGKAAGSLSAAFLRYAPSWAEEVFVLAPHDVPISERVAATATVWRGAHPIPDHAGEDSARRLLNTLERLEEDDVVLVLLSGGSSALLAAPRPGITLNDVQALTGTLLANGAPIQAVNTVRRELLAAAGGGLARAAYPAQVHSLVLSDVLGDDLPDIASGPTVPSPTTASEALAVLERFGGDEAAPQAVRVFLESRSTAESSGAWPHRSERCSASILANNHTARFAAAQMLEQRGYDVIRVSPALTGEASVRGRQLAGLVSAMKPTRPLAVVLGGETTVTVTGPGSGGRNQELALAAAQLLPGSGECAILAAATDGIDGFSSHAGALVDPSTWSRIASSGIDPAKALADNDSATALAAVDGVVVTGPTGTNVCDLTLLLAKTNGRSGRTRPGLA